MPDTFSLIIMNNDERFLERKIDAFLQEEPEPAVVIRRTNRPRVTSFREIVAAVPGPGRTRWPHWAARNWFVHAARGPGVDREARTDLAMDLGAAPEVYEARARYFISDFEWVLAPWYGTNHETCFAFFTPHEEIAERFSSCVPNTVAVPQPEGEEELSREMVVSRYDGITRLDHALNGAAFSDGECEGRLAWQTAADEGTPPLLICRFDEQSGTWWQHYTKDLEEIDRRAQGTIYDRHEYAVYRALDEVPYRAIWARASHDDAVAEYTVSGHGRAEDVLSCLDPNSSWLSQLRLVASRSHWAYTHCYGGGSNEYHALFWSENPVQTRDIYEQVRNMEDTRPLVGRMGRF